mmetsp:Transcript_25344/g.37899  ORF Transcript_25344/g.37899 Transcript_25344/m.37899 type:complete len:173 (-) Transcript_25344:9-527(-)
MSRIQLSSLLFLAVASFKTFKCNAYHIPLPLQAPLTPTIRSGSLLANPQGTRPAVRQHSKLVTSPLFADTTKRNLSSDGGEEKVGALKRFLKMFKPKSASENMTPKEMLAKMGLSALLSYGFVSNMSYCVTVSLAWFGFTKKTGMSPLAPGEKNCHILVSYSISMHLCAGNN